MLETCIDQEVAVQTADTTIQELQQQLAEQRAAVTARRAEADNLQQHLADSNSLREELSAAGEAHTSAAQVKTLPHLCCSLPAEAHFLCGCMLPFVQVRCGIAALCKN